MRHEAKSKIVLMCAAALAILLLPSPSQAQRYEVAGLVGYTTPGNIDNTARQVTDLEIAGSFTWGGQFGVFFSPHLGIEVSWAQQETQLGLTTEAGSASPFDIKAGQLHGNFVYQFSEEGARVRPYVLAGLGATFFRADNLESETKLSFAFGGGAKVFVQEHIGIKLQAKYNPTRLNGDDEANFCDPFGFCQTMLNQFELGGGMVFRF
jgi:opacity protein-like surface antigen